MAKIPIILEPGRADGKLTTSDAIFDKNKGKNFPEIIKKSKVVPADKDWEFIAKFTMFST